MSDSLTNIEMQDVLSSIRRLVSDKRPDKEEEHVQEDDRFILTPAHRVADDIPAQDVSDLPEFITRHKAQDSEKLESAPDEATNGSEDSAKSDTLEAETTAEDGAEEDEEFRADPWLSGLPAFERGERAADMTLEWAKPHNVSLESRIAELEVAVGREDDEWEPDGSEADASTPPQRHIFEVVDNTRAAEPKSEESHDEDSQDEEPLQLADVAVFSHVPRVAVPASEDDDDMVDHTLEKRRNVDVTSPAKKGDIVEGDDDLFVDEDILRRVVSEIVREELQGKMGERITRNVRRMVRREIEQTLLLRDMD